MFQPSMACSRMPSQVFCLSWNRKYSAKPCLIRRTKMVVELIPVVPAGSSAANIGMP